MNCKSKTTAALLAFFLGGFGVHNFYLGFKGRAIVQLLITVLSVGTLAGVSYLWAFVEFILILTGKISKDAAGNPFDGVQPIAQPQQTFVQSLAAQPVSCQTATSATFAQPTVPQASATSALTMSCPFCGEEISSKAIKCKHCQSMLNGITGTGAAQKTAGVDRSTAVEQFILSYHQNHRMKYPELKKGLFGTSHSHIYGGDEITSDVLKTHNDHLEGFNPSAEKPLVVVNKPSGLSGMAGGCVLTNRALYYKLSGGGLVSLKRPEGRIDINNIKSIVVGDSDHGYGGAYNGHELFVNGQKLGMLRMGTDACEDDETVEYSQNMFKQLTEQIFCR